MPAPSSVHSSPAPPGHHRAAARTGDELHHELEVLRAPPGPSCRPLKASALAPTTWGTQVRQSRGRGAAATAPAPAPADAAGQSLPPALSQLHAPISGAAKPGPGARGGATRTGGGHGVGVREQHPAGRGAGAQGEPRKNVTPWDSSSPYRPRLEAEITQGLHTPDRWNQGGWRR